MKIKSIKQNQNHTEYRCKKMLLKFCNSNYSPNVHFFVNFFRTNKTDLFSEIIFHKTGLIFISSAKRILLFRKVLPVASDSSRPRELHSALFRGNNHKDAREPHKILYNFYFLCLSSRILLMQNHLLRAENRTYRPFYHTMLSGVSQAGKKGKFGVKSNAFPLLGRRCGRRFRAGR